MATFVQLSDEDPVTFLVQTVAALKFKDDKAKQDAFVADLNKLIEGQKYSDVLQKAVFSNLDTILAADEADIDAVFNLAISIMPNLGDNDAEIRKAVDSFVKAFTKNSDHAVLKIKLLTTLFNMSSESPRFSIFVNIVKMALKTGHTMGLADQIAAYEVWMGEWKLSTEEQVEAYLLLAKLCKANGKGNDQQRFLFLYFQSLEKLSAAAQAEAKQYAAEAAIAAIESMDVLQCDTLLQLAAVKQLEHDAKYKVTYRLLSIMARDTVTEYSAFYKQNQKAISALGLDHEAVLKKMRSLTLCTLGANKQEVSYDELRVALQASNDDEVEEIVVDSVLSGVIDAKCDQLNSVVHLQRTTTRSFNKQTWNEIGQKLGKWRDNVQNVLEQIEGLRAQGRV